MGDYSKTGAAAFKSLTRKRSFSQFMVNLLHSARDFEIRIAESRLGWDSNGALWMEIQGRGLIPVARATNVGIIIGA